MRSLSFLNRLYHASGIKCVYYEAIKPEPHFGRHANEYRCDERLQTKAEECKRVAGRLKKFIQLKRGYPRGKGIVCDTSRSLLCKILKVEIHTYYREEHEVFVSSIHQADGLIKENENIVEATGGCVVIHFDNHLKEKKKHIQELRKFQNQRAKAKRQNTKVA